METPIVPFGKMKDFLQSCESTYVCMTFTEDKPPSMETLKRVAQFLDTSPSYGVCYLTAMTQPSGFVECRTSNKLRQETGVWRADYLRVYVNKLSSAHTFVTVGNDVAAHDGFSAFCDL